MNESRRCLHCNAEVPYNSNCPLCGRRIRDCAGGERYPDATDRRAEAKAVLKFIFIAISLAALCFDFILTHFSGWGAITASAFICIWFFIFRPLFVSRPFGIHVLYDVLVVIVLSCALDAIWGFSRWSVTYVWPASIAAGITVILFCSLIGRLKWSDVGAPLTILAIMSCVMLISGVFWLFSNNTLWFIITVYAALCVFGLKFFLNKAFDEDLKRIFHM